MERESALMKLCAEETDSSFFVVESIRHGMVREESRRTILCERSVS